MTLGAPEGVLSLRDALARAERAGATVEQHGAEIRVSAPGYKRLAISGGRKDETPELHKLIRALERAHDAGAVIPPSIGHLTPGSIGHRVASYIAALPADADGWRAYPGSGVMATAIGLPKEKHVQAAVWLSVKMREGRIEARRKKAPSTEIEAVRFTGRGTARKQPRTEIQRRAMRRQHAAPAQQQPLQLVEPPKTLPTGMTAKSGGTYEIRRDSPSGETVRHASSYEAAMQIWRELYGAQPRPANGRPAADYRDQPLQPAPAGMVPETPTLATYAEARKLSQANPMLHADPSPDQIMELLAEAVKLYWWNHS